VLGARQTVRMDLPRRPQVVAFDAVETLFSLAPVDEVMRGFGLGESMLERFFSRMLRDAFALGCSGRYRSFAEVAEATLTVVAPALSAAGRAEVMDAFRRLPAHVDARPAFEVLRERGIRVAVLTNGSAALTTHLLAANGLAEYVERVVSVDEVRTWKPQPAPYHHAAAILGLRPDQVALVAVHAWDTHGARAAGLVAGWSASLEGSYSATFDAAHVTGQHLTDVASALAALTD